MSSPPDAHAGSVDGQSARSSMDQHETVQPEQTVKHNLLTLPGELRNHIYRAAVVRSDPVPTRILYRGRTDTKHLWSVTPGEPSLALTRKDIRSEVLSIYYAENVFELVRFAHLEADDYRKCIRAWLRYLGSRASRILHLRLIFQYPIQTPISGLTKYFSEQFTVQLDILPHGTLIAKRWSAQKDTPHCVCGLYTTAATLRKKSHNRLLDLMALVLALAHANRVCTVVKICPRCKLPGLCDIPD
ncbi:hypothetical protein LTR85_001621 [Meristemomyces frigidus]|nr:hypothetical protein LTR85_001621 [Meristemomyces frigidus]